jgi:hypothetical protein
MDFPRLINFKFDIKEVYEVPTQFVGNPGRLAYDIYKVVDYYKPLCAANNIIISQGVRVGIRPLEEAYINDLKSDGYSESEIDAKINEMRDEITYSTREWISNGSIVSGYVSDIYLGRQLLIPTEESCKRWIGLYSDNG